MFSDAVTHDKETSSTTAYLQHIRKSALRPHEEGVAGNHHHETGEQNQAVLAPDWRGTPEHGVAGLVDDGREWIGEHERQERDRLARERQEQERLARERAEASSVS